MYSTLRPISFAVVLALSATFSASAQSVSVRYVDGEPRLWGLGTALLLRHVEKTSSFELISQDSTKTTPRVVSYMNLRFVTYRSDQVGLWPRRLIWDERQHILKLSWNGELSHPFVASFEIINGSDVCAQVKRVEMGWGQHVVRANPLASMYCPDAPPQSLLLLIRLVQPAVLPSPEHR